MSAPQKILNKMGNVSKLVMHYFLEFNYLKNNK